MHALRSVLALATVVIALQAGFPASAAPVVPDPSACQTVPQRSLLVLFATPTGATHTADASSPTVPLSGSPADAAMTDTVFATTEAVVACLNAGDYWSLITLVSDDYLMRAFVEGTPADPLATELAPFINALRGCQQCEIAPRTGEDRLAIVAINNIRVLQEDRIAFDLELASPSGANPLHLAVILVAVDDRWVVDAITASGTS